MTACVVDVSHPEGVLATWANTKHPKLMVCDHHKKQYDSHPVYFDDTWSPILRDGSVEKHHPRCNCKRLCGGEK